MSKSSQQFGIVCLAHVALLLAIGGCGSGSTHMSHMEMAKQVILRPADLPKVWDKSPPTHGKVCHATGVSPPVKTFTTHFAAGLDDIQQRVMLFGTAEDAQRAYIELSSEEGDRCFQSIVQQEVVAYSGGPLLKPLRVLEQVDRPDIHSKQMVLTVESPIGPAHVYVNDLKGLGGRRVTTVRLSAGLTPFPEPLYQHVMQLMKERLRESEGAPS